MRRHSCTGAGLSLQRERATSRMPGGDIEDARGKGCAYAFVRNCISQLAQLSIIFNTQAYPSSSISILEPLRRGMHLRSVGDGVRHAS
jgi:hypothetical protein